MPEFGLAFHHLGLAVRSDDRAIRFLSGLGYRIGERIHDPEQDVHLRMCAADHAPAVEVITPGHGDGPLTPILKRYNEMIYHVCYEAGDVPGSLEAMQAADLVVMPVAGRKPAILFGGRIVSFYKVLGFGLIELLEP